MAKKTKKKKKREEREQAAENVDFEWFINVQIGLVLFSPSLGHHGKLFFLLRLFCLLPSSTYMHDSWVRSLLIPRPKRKTLTAPLKNPHDRVSLSLISLASFVVSSILDSW